MRVLIVGAGLVGSNLAKFLAEKGHDVIVVDKDPERCEAITQQADVQAIARDATDPSLYEEIDMATIDVVVAATNRDEVNLLVATLAKDYGVPRVLSRVRDRRIAALMERLGIEYIVVEPYVTARLLEAIIEGKYSVVNLAPTFTGNYVLVAFTLTETDSAVGKTLDEIDYPRNAARILAVFDGETLRDPMEVEQLMPNYVIIALVRADMVEEFINAFR